MRVYAYLSIIVLGSSTAIASSDTSTEYRNVVTHPPLKLAQEVSGACVTYSDGSMHCTPSPSASSCLPSALRFLSQWDSVPRLSKTWPTGGLSTSLRRSRPPVRN